MNKVEVGDTEKDFLKKSKKNNLKLKSKTWAKGQRIWRSRWSWRICWTAQKMKKNTKSNKSKSNAWGGVLGCESLSLRFKTLGTSML